MNAAMVRHSTVQKQLTAALSPRHIVVAWGCLALSTLTPTRAHAQAAPVVVVPADTDSDGVVDDNDQCPNEAAGLFPDPARRGCPLPDGDHDTVPDALDGCPVQGGAPSADPARNGCPCAPQVTYCPIDLVVPIRFTAHKAELGRQSMRQLTRYLEAISVMPTDRRVVIEGHATTERTEAGNQRLSLRRAQRVLQWFVQHGVAAERFTVQAMGSTRPIVAEAEQLRTPANNRVELRDERR